MGAINERFRLPAGTAEAVDAMHATPVMRNVLATARFLALDLFAGAGLIALLTAVIMVWYPARTGLLALIAAVAALGLVLYVGALRFRHITDAAELPRTAERLAALFDVPYVVFGHSHTAGTWPLAGGSTYVNVGTWVPEGEAAYFVYFAVTGSGAERRAGLWRWNKSGALPQPFDGEASASTQAPAAAQSDAASA